MSEEAAVAIGISVLLVLIWADDAWGTWRDWRMFRDARGFRAFLKATLIFLGTIAFLLGAIGYFWLPAALEPARFMGWVVRAGLLIVGVVIWIIRHVRRG